MKKFDISKNGELQKKKGNATQKQGITILGHFFKIYKKKRGNYTQKP